MESNDFESMDRIAERAEAAPWVEFPPTPRWYPPAAGVWAALLTLGLADLGSVASGAALALVVLAAVAFVVWYRRYRGTEPAGLPPVEMRRPMPLVATGLLGTLALAALLVWQLPTWVATLAVLVVVTALVGWYERAYAAGAAAARARLR